MQMMINTNLLFVFFLLHTVGYWTQTSCFDLQPAIEVRVVEGVNTYTVDITTTGCGSLYSSYGGAYGWHMVTYSTPEKRTLRVPGSGAIDINYAPVEGRVYCFVNNSGMACSQSLGVWQPYKMYLPIFMR